MTRKEKLVEYIHGTIDPSFKAESDQLIAVLDSVSLMQMILFIEQELGITLDVGTLGIDMFATVDTVIATLNDVEPEQAAA